ncbi:MAG: ABC transporter permease [Gemmataceae bacterium]|nr:ABC transporter permease [Gemmataceae bacterium]
MKKLVGITVFLLVVYGALLISDPSAATLSTHLLIGQRIGLYGILSLAAGLLIITGGIDLSIGSLICLSSTVFGLLVVNAGWPVIPAFLVMLLLGVGVGLGNGLLVTQLRLQPFMVTLCGLFVFRSLARVMTNDATIEDLGARLEALTKFFEGSLLGVPVYLVVLLALSAVGVVFLHFSVYGRYFVAIGSNDRAARFSGIAVDRYKVLAYVLCSVLTCVYSFLALMKTPSVSPSNVGEYGELIAIAGAVLGGCTLRGGEGTIYGMIVGTMIIQILRMMNTFWGIPSAAEGMLIGLILLAGIILDELLRRRQSGRQH